MQRNKKLVPGYRSFPVDRGTRALSTGEPFGDSALTFIRSDRWFGVGYVEFFRLTDLGFLERYRLHDNGRMEYHQQGLRNHRELIEERKGTKIFWNHDVHVQFVKNAHGPHWAITMMQFPVKVYEGRLTGNSEMTYLVTPRGVAHVPGVNRLPVEVLEAVAQMPEAA